MQPRPVEHTGIAMFMLATPENILLREILVTFQSMSVEWPTIHGVVDIIYQDNHQKLISIALIHSLCIYSCTYAK